MKHTFQQHSNCLAHIFILQGYPAKLQLVEESWKTKQPNYVIAFFTGVGGNPKTFQKAISHSHYTSALFFAVLNWEKVYWLCQLCKYDVSRRITVLKDFSVEMHRYIREIDLHQRFINTDLTLSEKQTIKGTCDLNPGKYGVSNRPPTVEICIINAIGVAYNFSYYPKKIPVYKSMAGYARLQRRQTLSVHYVHEIMELRRQIVPIGLIFDEWSYLVAKDKIGVFTNVLTGPFGLYIWLGIFTSFIASFFLHICTVKFQTKQANLSLKKISDITKTLHASFLDQLDASPISNLNLRRYSKLTSQSNWIIWVLSMLTLSSLYTGELFCRLTKTRDQTAPTSLEKLAMTNIEIYTFQFGMRIYTKAEVILQIEDILDTGSFPAYYPRLHRALKYIPHWLFGMRKFTSQLFLQYNPHLLENSTSKFNIKEEFAVMGLNKHVLMHRYLMNLYTPKK